VLGVSPSSAFTITEGAELVKVYSQAPMEWHFCSKCGTVVNQQPKGLPGIDFVGVLPTTFRLERADAPNNGALLLPDKYLPQAHVNYESRLVDYQDSLPKFKVFEISLFVGLFVCCVWVFCFVLFVCVCVCLCEKKVLVLFLVCCRFVCW